MSWLSNWFGYGLGAATGKALFGDGAQGKERPPGPIQAKTEAEIQADEKRFAEDEKRLDAADRQKKT